MKLEIGNNGYSLETDARCTIHDAKILLVADGREFSCLDNAVRAGEHAYLADVYDGKLRVSINFILTDRLLVKIEVENNSAEAITLDRCYPMRARIDMDCPVGEINVQCYCGHTQHNEVRPLIANSAPAPYGAPVTWFPYEAGKHRSVFLGNMFSRTTNCLLNISFLTFDRVYGFIQYYADGKNAMAESYCDFQNYSLEPGRIIAVETFRIAASSDKNACLNGWAEEVKSQYCPRFRFRPSLGIISMGSAWMGDGARYEELVRKNFQAARDRLKGFDVEFHWISIANLKDQLPGNWLINNDYKLPSGLAKLSQDMQKSGMKLGLWMAPFWVPDRNSRQAEEQADQLLRLDGNNVLYKKGWSFIASFVPEQERVDFYVRDGSHPEAQQYIREVFAAYREMGVRYYMIDFLRAGAGKLAGPYGYNEYYDQTRVNGPEVFRQLLHAVREGAGEDAYLLAATGPTVITTGIVDTTRVGPDLGEGRAPWTGAYGYAPASYGLLNRTMFQTAYNNYAHNYFCNNRLYHVDASNMVSVDKPISITEAQITLSMAALTSSSMILGDRMWDISDERLTMLKKALPQNAGEHAVPMDFMNCVYPDIPGVYHLKVNRRWGSYSVVGLLNIADKERTFDLDFKELGFDGNCVVYDFWNELFLGIQSNTTQTIAPWTIKVLRIAQIEDKPQLLGTDMHILQGAVEIEHVDWRDHELTVAATRPIGEKGTVSLLAPVRYEPASSYMDFHSARVLGTDYYILSKHLEFDTGVKIFNVKFTERT